MKKSQVLSLQSTMFGETACQPFLEKERWKLTATTFPEGEAVTAMGQNLIDEEKRCLFEQLQLNPAHPTVTVIRNF